MLKVYLGEVAEPIFSSVKWKPSELVMAAQVLLGNHMQPHGVNPQSRFRVWNFGCFAEDF